MSDPARSTWTGTTTRATTRRYRTSRRLPATRGGGRRRRAVYGARRSGTATDGPALTRTGVARLRWRLERRYQGGISSGGGERRVRRRAARAAPDESASVEVHRGLSSGRHVGPAARPVE